MFPGNGLHVSTRAISGALVHMRERVPTVGGQRGGGGGISTPKQRHFFQRTCAFFIFCQNHFYREIEELSFFWTSPGSYCAAAASVAALHGPGSLPCCRFDLRPPARRAGHAT